ncbi:heme-dependent peroxidase [Bifidobacterium aemilianum]|uniref:Coproheme decarboxylase n=1 Tax=Bifidobacterium aemilianum TaxID=2493120 RepID=A0A366K8T1_9BIFI|nr:hydrogen peroxide-dependent heme synthase [Bifidobacterium aemilianum]RBP98074.1 heme-dependent peroxidase [Bifidobacterium aemilianum]
MAEQAAESLEGWYCLHLFWKMDWSRWRKLTDPERESLLQDFRLRLEEFAGLDRQGQGCHYLFKVIGQKADLGLMVLRQDLGELADLTDELGKLPLFDYFDDVLSFLSVTEVGLYGGKPQSERAWAHVDAALHPAVPTEPYICFYPMSKLRLPDANWYTLPYEQRQAYMKDHGLIGRSYAGRVSIILTGAIGLDDHEWGVSLFAQDPLEFKKIVTEMRYIEASSIYGDFPYFLVGQHLDTDALGALLLEGLAS